MSKKTEHTMLERAGFAAKGDVRNRIENPSEVEQRPTRIADVLSELYNLLEQYAPPWYTQELHEKVKTALQEAKSRRQIGKAV